MEGNLLKNRLFSRTQNLNVVVVFIMGPKSDETYALMYMYNIV